MGLRFDHLNWFKKAAAALYKAVCKCSIRICSMFFPAYAKRLQKERAQALQRIALAKLYEAFDFQEIAFTFPFMKSKLPQNGEEAVEYLGELLVEIDRRDLAEIELTEKTNSKGEELKTQGWVIFLNAIRAGFETRKNSANRIVDEEFKYFTNVADWFGKFQKDHKDFQTRTLQECLKEESLVSIQEDAIRKTEHYIQAEWSEFTQRCWELDIPGTVKLSSVVVSWENQTGKAVGATFGVAAAGTVTLALGWHTLAWSIANFFPPALLVASIGAVLIGAVKRDETAERMKSALGKKIDEVCKCVCEGAEAQVKPSLFASVDGCSKELIGSGVAQIWETRGGVRPNIEEVKKKIDVEFNKARVQLTTAEAYRQMEKGVAKANDSIKRDDFVSATTHFGTAFDGLLNWSSKILCVPLDTWGSKDYQKEFIDRLPSKGIGSDTCRKYDGVRLFRNKAIHERERLLLRNPMQFKKALKMSIADMEEVILVIKGKTHERM
jgi:hypothetical protein